MSQVHEVVVRCEGLEARYGSRIILEGINLEVYRGEILAILGGSGCGKTTLLKHLIGLLRPYRGKVELWGKEVAMLTESEWEEVRRRMGVLFQNGALLGSKSLMVNVAIPLEMHTQLDEKTISHRVREKLKLVGLEHAVDLLPSELSGGMRKRAGLARALALDPELLFCDEPSAGLDPPTARSLDHLLLDLRRQLGLTIVVVTHEVASIFRIADRIAFLDKGRLVFTGTIEEAQRKGVQPVIEFFRHGELAPQN